MSIMKIKKILLNEYIFAIIMRGIVIIIGLLRTVFWARYLGASLKGDVEYIRSIASIGLIVFTLGIQYSYPHLRKESGRERVLHPFMRISTRLFIVYLVMFTALFSLFFQFNESFAIAILLIPILSYSRIVQYIYIIENPNRCNTKNLIVNLIELVYSILLLYFAKRLFFLGITSIISVELLQAVSSIKYLGTGFEKQGEECSGNISITMKQLVLFGFFPMISLLLTTLNYKIDVIMLRSYSFIDSADIGVYSLGIALVEKIILIPDTLKGVLVSRLAKGKDAHEVAKLTRICFALSTIIAVVVIVVGKPLILLFYGEEYAGAYSVIVISAFGVLFIMFFKLIAQYNNINKRQKRNALMLASSILVNVLMNALLIPLWGTWGAALSTGIGHAVCGAMFILDFHRQTNIPIKEILILRKEDFCRIKLLRGAERIQKEEKVDLQNDTQCILHEEE